MPGGYPPIEAHGVIGDLQTVALVARDGTIDFWCAPSFDSPSVFLALLDRQNGGAFSVHPMLERVRHRQLYLPDTNVLLTRYLAPDGVAEISDFMPIDDGGGDAAPVRPSRIVRRVKTVRGEIRFRVRCAPRFDYARAEHTVEQTAEGALFVTRRGDAGLRLTTSAPITIRDGDVHAEVTLAAGESLSFILEYFRPDELRAPPAIPGARFAPDSFKATVNFWREWIGRSTYSGRWRDEVNRSALALKMLHSRQTGAIIAAPTFGLPETIGGVRNWDYRYTWIRDASFTLYSLIRLGLTSETKSFIDWIATHATGKESRDGDGPLNTMYGIDGRNTLDELTLDHLEGYRGSRPVRIGNAASNQLQLDIYGELIDSIYLYDRYGEPTSYELWNRIAQLVDWTCEHWEKPDEGIWEIRAGRRHHLYSRIMCWVAIDRGLRLAMKRSLPAPLEQWLRARDAIYRDVFENFWDEAMGAFVGDRDGRRLDAACLIMPLVRFIAPTDPRFLSTLRAVEKRLVSDSLVFRYEIEGEDADGLPGTEGTFSICSFWYIECLSRAGDIQQARFLLEKMFGYANHLGLYAEQIGPTGEHLGNFPQAFTHLALISAAYDLDRRLSGAGWKA
jgi:GH15 family glucan-1,4-alpha-glucosidase